MATPEQLLAANAGLATSLKTIADRLAPAPWILDGVEIPRPLTSRRTRLMCCCNPTPVASPNPRWVGPGDPDPAGEPRWVVNDLGHDYMVSLGYEESFMIYVGTLNEAMAFVQRDAAGQIVRGEYGRPQPLANYADVAAHLDWSWASGGTNPVTKQVNPPYYDPPDSLACSIAGMFAVDPNRYADAPANRMPTRSARPHLPVFFDIEAAKFLAVDPTDVPGRVAALKAIIAAVRSVRLTAGLDQEIYWYGQDYLAGLVYGYNLATVSGDPTTIDPQLASLWLTLRMELSGWVAMGYYWDFDEQNRGPGPWLWSLNAAGAWMRRAAPEFADGPKILVLNPTIQIDAPQNDAPAVAAMNLKPIPFPIWKAGVDKAVEDGWWILLWYGGLDTPEAVGVRPHLAYLAQMGVEWNEGTKTALN